MLPRYISERNERFPLPRYSPVQSCLSSSTVVSIKLIQCFIRSHTMSSAGIIEFEQLPLDPQGPPGNAWGRFGKDDELGMLNLITPDMIVKAAQEIKTGVRISLDWPLSMPSYPSFGRNPFQQEIVHRAPNCINDDILQFNTQGSTQWDGFRHYGMDKESPLPIWRTK